MKNLYPMLLLLMMLWLTNCEKSNEPIVEPEPIPESPVPETPATEKKLELVWADEFEGATLNRENWSFDLGDGCPDLCNWGNNEEQTYTDRPENLRIEDGVLVMEAHKENLEGKRYTSSRIITKGKQEFTFGRMDIRAKLPKGQGIWPAIWMLGANIDQVSWPACGEIDIMEIVGHEPNVLHGTVHYGDPWPNNSFTGGKTTIEGTFADDFHVFSIEWELNEIRFLLDDKQYFGIMPSSLDRGKIYPFNLPFYFIMNVAVGGNWPGSPDATTEFPQRMEVDYVRVYQYK